MNWNIKSKLEVIHNITTFKADGTVDKVYPPMKNLITNAGLNELALFYYAEVTQYMRIGTGDTAAEYTDTELDNEVEYSNTYDETAGMNGTSVVSAGGVRTFTYKRTVISTGSYPSGLTVKEIAFSPREDLLYLLVGSPPVEDPYPIFSRLVPDTPIVISADGYMSNTCVLNVIYDGSTITGLTIPITGISGDCSTHSGMGAVVPGTDISKILSDGTVGSVGSVMHNWCYESCWVKDHYGEIAPIGVTPKFYVSTDQSAVTSVYATQTAPNVYFSFDGLKSPYVDDSYERVINTNNISGDDFASTAWRTVAIMPRGTDHYWFRMLFDEDQIMAVGDFLSLTITKSWARG